MKSDLNLKWCGICCITFLAFLDCVLNLIRAQTEFAKTQLQIAAEIYDRGDIIKYLFKSIAKEPLVRILLDRNQIRNFKNFVGLGITHTEGSAGFDWSNSVFFHVCSPLINIFCASIRSISARHAASMSIGRHHCLLYGKHRKRFCP